MGLQEERVGLIVEERECKIMMKLVQNCFHFYFFLKKIKKIKKIDLTCLQMQAGKRVKGSALQWSLLVLWAPVCGCRQVAAHGRGLVAATARKWPPARHPRQVI